MPDVAKMNVSQEEYSRMYNVYLRSVEENARRHENRREATKVNRFFSFTHAHTQQRTTHGGRSRRAAAHRTWLYFPVDIPETRQQHVEIEHATLRLFMLAGSTASTVHLRVYQVLQPSPQYPYQEERLLVDQTVVTLNPSASRWTDLDVTRAAQAWNLGGNETNLGLEVECRDCVNQGIVFVTQETSGSNSSVSPVLNLLAGIHLDTREKRSTNGNDPLNVQERQKGVCHKDGQKCCRHVMKVNFKEIEGFEFILQPKEFDAGYCKGRCPPRYNPAHHHALLQSLVRKQQSHADNRIPRVCCAPSRLKDLEVLHLDMEDPTKLKMTLWDNMQVLECACS